MSTVSRRGCMRHALQARIDVIEGYLGVTIRFSSQNIGSGGVFLESDLLYDPGEVIWLSFTLPSALEIRTRGRVVWTKKDVDADDPEDRPGMGVEFLDLSSGEKAALEEFLNSSYFEKE